MAERRTSFGVMSMRLQLLRFQIEHQVRKTRYQIQVPEIERSRAEAQSRAFNGEFLAFLNENPSAILGLLSLNRYQISVVNLLFGALRDGRLLEVENEGVINHGKSSHRIKHRVSIRNSLIPLAKLESELSTLWDVTRQYPHHSTLSGELSSWKVDGLIDGVDEIFPPWVTFVFFPQKITTAEDASRLHNWFTIQKKKNQEREVDVIDQGRLILVKSRFNFKGETINRVERYVLLGAFDGDETGRTYYVYGCNEGYNQERREPIKSVVHKTQPNLAPAANSV